MSNSLQPHVLQPARFLCPWNFPGKNTGAGCISYSKGSSWPKDQSHVSCVFCIGRFLTTAPLGKPESIYTSVQKAMGNEIGSVKHSWAPTREEEKQRTFWMNFYGHLLFFHTHWVLTKGDLHGRPGWEPSLMCLLSFQLQSTAAAGSKNQAVKINRRTREGTTL